MAKRCPVFNKYFIILMAVNFSVAFSYYITFLQLQIILLIFLTHQTRWQG